MTEAIGSEQISSNRIVALVLLSNPGSVAGVVLPALVNAFVASGISVSVASSLVATELFSCAVVTLVAPLFLNTVDRRYLAAAGTLLAAAGQFLSLLPEPTEFLFACRAGVGLGAGLLYGVALASLSATSKPARFLAIALASNLIAATSIMALASYLAPGLPLAAIWIMAVFVALHLPLTLAVPARVRAASHRRRANAANGNWRIVILGLAGMFCLSMGFGVVWPMMGQIGAHQHVDHAMIAIGFSFAGFGGIAGAILSAGLSGRLGRRTVLLLGVTGLALSVSLTLTPAFAAAMLLFMACWTFSVPHYISLLTEIDGTGRLSVLTSSMIPFGISAGQAFAAVLTNHGVHFIIYGGVTALLTSLLVMLSATALMRRETVGPADLKAVS